MVDVQVGESSMGEGKGGPAMSQLMCQQLDDPEVCVDEEGYPTIFGDIISSQVALDEYGHPTIFGDIIKTKFENSGWNVICPVQFLDLNPEPEGLAPVGEYIDDPWLGTPDYDKK